MEVLTPLQSIFGMIEKKLTENEVLGLKKEIINTYAEGYFDAQGEKKNLEKALLSSMVLKDIKNDEIISWIKTQTK